MTRRFFARAGRCLLVGVVLLMGCGGGAPLGTVEGHITYKGDPVYPGLVIFQNAEGSVAVLAHLTSDGFFRIETHDQKGLPPGEYRVTVKPTPAAGDPIPLAGAAKEKPAPRDGSLIPAKFHSVETSPLTAQVRAGANPRYEFDLDR